MTENQTKIQRLLDAANARDLEPEEMADTVEDAADEDSIELANAANEEGLEAQITFLVQKCSWKERDVLQAIDDCVYCRENA